jgi:hypothetical protein
MTTSHAPPANAAPNTAYPLDQANFPATISIAKDIQADLIAGEADMVYVP